MEVGKMKKRKWLGVVIGVMATLLLSISALAAVLANPVTIVDTLPIVVMGIGSSPYRDTFCAEGRHWIVYINGHTDLVYKSALETDPDNWSNETDIVTVAVNAADEYGVWYDESTNTVHYARYDRFTIPMSIVYGMGIPSSAGVITWATTEQFTENCSGAILTPRVNISVDENDYPWVMWTDTDNVTPGVVPVVHVRSSSTKNGTWTENAARNADNISVPDGWAWFLQGSPIGATGDVMEIEWSSENLTNHVTGLYAITYNGTGYEQIESIVELGNMNHERPDAFSCYDIGSAIHSVYTDVAGLVKYRARSQIQTWNATAAAVMIKEDGVTLRIPTLSGYKQATLGEDLICIVADNNTLWYDIKPYGVAFPGVWTEIWTNPYIDITRHVASYKYSSPLGFAWQQIETTGDDVEYWWIDNTNDILGYYTNAVSSLPGTGLFIALAIVALLAGSVIILMATLMGQLTVKVLIYTGIGVVFVYFVVTTLINLLF